MLSNLNERRDLKDKFGFLLICLILLGHSWGEIVHKHAATWLASYKDDSVKV